MSIESRDGHAAARHIAGRYARADYTGHEPSPDTNGERNRFADSLCTPRSTLKGEALW